MLTLNEPIKLNCCDSRLSLTEGFCERILGNYTLMGASFGPKDLLFLLTTPPDFPDDLGGMTTFSAQTNISDNRSVVLDVVNHVVNRVLLSSQPSFTYQDQVYLTTALHKLGITDVTQFMGEVRSLREEERSVATLLALYREESRRAATPPAGKGEAGPLGQLSCPQERARLPRWPHHATTSMEIFTTACKPGRFTRASMPTIAT